MSTTRINFATINATTMETLSAFNKAYHELRSLRDTFKAENKKIEDSIEEILETRKNAIDNGMSVDEATSLYSIEAKSAEIRALRNKYESDCKPHKDAQRECMKWVDSNLYYGYVLAQKGSLSAKGKVKIGKQSVNLEKSYVDMIKDFLVAIGCSKTDDVKALNKFAQAMAVRTSGMIKCNKGDDYVKVKSASQYNNLFILNFLQFLVVERCLLVENEDHTLSMKIFE